jgi:hypothetical protein
MSILKEAFDCNFRWLLILALYLPSRTLRVVDTYLKGSSMQNIHSEYMFAHLDSIVCSNLRMLPEHQQGSLRLFLIMQVTIHLYRLIGD